MNKNEEKTIFGQDYTLEDVDWCCQVGYPVEHGRLNYGEMTMGLWNGSERAYREMREYMQSHNFLHLEDAAQTYCAIMRDVKGLNNVTDARLLYEHYLGLPYECEYDPDYRNRLVTRWAKYEKIIRVHVKRHKNRAYKAMREERIAA